MTPQQFNYLHDQVFIPKVLEEAIAGNLVFELPIEIEDELAFQKTLSNSLKEVYAKFEDKNEIRIGDGWKYLLKLHRKLKSEFSNILFDGKISFGICQMILNTYLKLCWCSSANFPVPPACPIGDLVLNHFNMHSELRKQVNDWRRIDDFGVYVIICRQLPKQNGSLAEWELGLTNLTQ